MTGQGSHFPKRDEPAANTTTSPQNTTSGYVPDAKRATETSSTSGISGERTSIATMGETSTYSSHTLPEGDAVASVVDPTSIDLATYQMPEHSYGSSTGVPAGAAGGAASTTSNKDRNHSTSHIPGALPKHEPSTTDSARTASAAAGTSSTAPAQDSTTVPPSALTTIASPADRPAENSRAEKPKVSDVNISNQTPTATPDTTTARDSAEPPKSGVMAWILEAMGLGAVAGSAGIVASQASEDDKTQAMADTPEPPTTTTGIDSYTVPTRSGPPPPHHKKKSIPTTAYPAGLNSPAPVNAPRGGTSAAQEETEFKDHIARNPGLATAGVGAGPAGVYALNQKKEAETGNQLADHSYSTTQAPRDAEASKARIPTFEKTASTQEGLGTSTKETTGAAPAATAIPASEEAPNAEPATEPLEMNESHIARNAALARAAGAGAGACGVHEDDKHQAEQEDARQKQFGKDQKAAEEQAAQEKKQYQKELEKEEKAREKAAAKEEKERLEAGEAAAASAVGTGATAGTGAYAMHDNEQPTEEIPTRTTGSQESDRHRLYKDPPEEKKPNIFKRIFKRRKNKETGQEEEYSTDEEDETHRHYRTAEAATVGDAGAAVPTGTAAAYHESEKPHTSTYRRPSETVI
ncbi:uncharacterized protein Z518_02706 [Rhinocladiella mackenziei CBS 650.93]|uniref:Uncharacterized protein n=1 Tax=Rhinocladiella mackenziei CBS 650.93 TaxID=1442369 RepID=A0A0D2IXJ3_9EURO|nr:uncharacterized protein Z518_02706 [Rhinocladiella mackenziei CBS 650.93]KIX08051.1 hypothetical protein Z518_02706 [Rhinocladiella mackenziei CBS 650.93]